MDEVLGVIVAAIVIVCFGMLFGLVMAFPVMWTWNGVIPYLFGLPVLTWGKAWCLMFLSGTLIKSHHSSSKK